MILKHPLHAWFDEVLVELFEVDESWNFLKIKGKIGFDLAKSVWKEVF